MKNKIIAVILTVGIITTNTKNIIAITVNDVDGHSLLDNSVEETVVETNKQLYSTYIEELKLNVLEKVKKVNKNVDIDIINLAFTEADKRKSMNDISIEEYFTLVALHLATMEVESNFNNDTICKNPTTVDYGIMQVNTLIIPEAKKGLEDSSLDVHDLEDNVAMGSWELYECYKKAKEKHPDNVLWYYYSYYNRGLWFENYEYNYDQANKRASKFIKKFNKYFKILYNK